MPHLAAPAVSVPAPSAMHSLCRRLFSLLRPRASQSLPSSACPLCLRHRHGLTGIMHGARSARSLLSASASRRNADCELREHLPNAAINGRCPMMQRGEAPSACLSSCALQGAQHRRLTVRVPLQLQPRGSSTGGRQRRLSGRSTRSCFAAMTELTSPLFRGTQRAGRACCARVYGTCIARFELK